MYRKVLPSLMQFSIESMYSQSYYYYYYNFVDKRSKLRKSSRTETKHVPLQKNSTSYDVLEIEIFQVS